MKKCVHKIATLSTPYGYDKWWVEHNLIFVSTLDGLEIPKSIGSIERVKENAERWIVKLIIEEGYVGDMECKELYEDILKELGEKK